MEEIQKHIIRESLYRGEIDLFHASDKDIALYKEIIQEHIILLNKKITQDRDIDFIKGFVVVSGSLVYGYLFCKNFFYPYMAEVGLLGTIYISLYFFACIFSGHMSDANVFKEVSNLYLAIFSLVLLLKGAKSVFNYLHRLWYAKEYIYRDLLRDEAMLARLEKCKQ
jgi:hypothetical protein